MTVFHQNMINDLERLSTLLNSFQMLPKGREHCLNSQYTKSPLNPFQSRQERFKMVDNTALVSLVTSLLTLKVDNTIKSLVKQAE